MKRSEDDTPSGTLGTLKEEAPKRKASFPAFDFGIFKKIVFLALLFLTTAAVLVILGPPAIEWARSRGGSAAPLSLRLDNETAPSKKIPAAPGAQAVLTPPKPTEEDLAILKRRVSLSGDRTLSPAEQEILGRQVQIESGLVEKLPSQPWTLENFKQMISEQERFYKISLSGSYKKKLEKGFKEKYLAAQEAFKSGDLLKARNLWTESLIFPIYADDLRKHRGIVLTMLKAYINDTLSKIGAINTSLAEGVAREKELVVTEAYGALNGAIAQKSWGEALELLQRTEDSVEKLQRPDMASAQVPPYPASAGQVDQDVLRAMMDLLTPQAPAVANLGPLEEDLRAKRVVLEGMSRANVEAQKGLYDEALDLLDRGEWSPALQKLREIRTPPELKEDAAEKVRLLEKLLEGSAEAKPAPEA
ncbi:MAG: hypothetical protein WCU74_04950 [Candidatus Omnitrophota bacterium]